MIKITKRNLQKDSNPYYVVTREGRRVEDKNYKEKYDAEERALKLVAMIQEYSPFEKNSVSIVYTSEPYRIR